MRNRRNNSAFTLVELLVVIAIIALLVSIILPSLSQAKRIAEKAYCSVSARGLVTANHVYAENNNEHYVPAAEDICSFNRKRWHGQRNNTHEAFDSLRSPLREYMPAELKECPTFNRMKDQFGGDQFERAAGGFGYNASYVGGRFDLYDRDSWEPGKTPDSATARASDICSLQNTVMFTDAAMVQKNGGSTYFIEYSFCEPPKFVYPTGPIGRASPSIHFRHMGQVNVAWADGHVSSEVIRDSAAEYGLSKSQVLEHNIGWFEPTNSNDLFDLK